MTFCIRLGLQLFDLDQGRNKNCDLSLLLKFVRRDRPRQRIGIGASIKHKDPTGREIAPRTIA
jgi:hypothetical protein